MTFRPIDPAAAKIYYAEEADRPITTSGVPDGSLVIFTDTGLEESFDAVAGAWFNREQLRQGSGDKLAGFSINEDAAVGFGPIYNDGTYKYYGEAAPGTLTATAAWRVSRMRISDSYFQWVDNGNYTQVYDVEATIAALVYV